MKRQSSCGENTPWRCGLFSGRVLMETLINCELVGNTEEQGDCGVEQDRGTLSIYKDLQVTCCYWPRHRIHDLDCNTEII